MSLLKLEQPKQAETAHQNGHVVNGVQKANGVAVNGKAALQEDVEEDLLFTSESVGEGHPGKCFTTLL